MSDSLDLLVCQGSNSGISPRNICELSKEFDYERRLATTRRILFLRLCKNSRLNPAKNQHTFLQFPNVNQIIRIHLSREKCDI